MAGERIDPIAKRMASLSDEELARVFGVDAGDWGADAQAAARAELERRGTKIVEAPGTRSAAVSDGQVSSGDPRRPIYTKGVPMTIIVALIIKALLLLLRD